MSGPPVNIEDLRQLAKRRLPRPFYGYMESGSFEELALHANRRDLDALQLCPRVLAGVGDQRNLSSTMLGQSVSMPVAIAPTGLAGLLRADGEILAARAAHRAGLPYTLSTVSSCAIEDVRAAVPHPFWFQLYFMRDRGVVASLVERAMAAQCSAMMVTVDLSVQAPRLRDERNGMTLHPRLFNLPNALDFARKPAWIVRRLRSKHQSFGNLLPYAPNGKAMHQVSTWVADQLDPTMQWSDLEWLRNKWPGKLIVKGLMHPQDALQAVRLGADAVVVSNHGGRQFDAAPSTISALPAIVEALAGEKAQVFFDGGVRSGTDVLKALASGAHGVLLGRATLYGLVAMGEPGVTLALDLIRRELDMSMALAGCRDVSAVNGDLLWRANA